MNEWPPFVPYLILATISGAASVAIVIVAMAFIFGRGGGNASDTGMLAIAGMAFAPAAMGIGIASYLPRDRH
jgi:hypothetical protein